MTVINKILGDYYFKIIVHSIFLFNIICIMLLLMLVLMLCFYILASIIKYISNNININIITKEQFESCVCSVKGSGNINVDLPSVNAPQLPKQPELLPLPTKPDTPEVPLPNYPQVDKPDTTDTPSIACDPVSMVLNSVFIW